MASRSGPKGMDRALQSKVRNDYFFLVFKFFLLLKLSKFQFFTLKNKTKALTYNQRFCLNYIIYNILFFALLFGW